MVGIYVRVSTEIQSKKYSLERMFPLPLNREMAEFFVIRQVSMIFLN